MAIAIVKLGTKRKRPDLRLGTVRRPPRGVRKEDYARLDYYDVWFPQLSPSAELMQRGRDAQGDAASWAKFTKGFMKEMKAPAAAQALDLLAALSHQTDLSLGCYCQDEAFCHRSLLRRLLESRGAELE